MIIDCDPGADDVLALLFALGCPEIEVLAVTIVAGNRRAEICAQNAMKVLEYCNRTDIPVYVGADGPLVRILPKDDVYSGRDGMAEMFLPYAGSQPQPQHAVDKLCEIAAQNPGEVYILSMAPMTNLALALDKDASFVKNVAQVITINGSYGVTVNLERFNSRIEWNISVDPEAAKMVLESGLPITALGIDVTGQLSNTLHENLLRRGTVGTVPYNMLADAEKFLRTRGLEPAGLYVDTMAVAYLVAPEIAQLVQGKVAVETKGEVTTGL
ncbi:MAG: nucleoside hydrolase, partial [Angelakisella sp.]